MEPDGEGVLNLSRTGGDSPAWSPDGSDPAFTSSRDGNSDIYRVNADGTGRKSLTNAPDDDRGPGWRPRP